MAEKSDWLRPPAKDSYDSTETVPFGEWLRQTRENGGADEAEQALARSIERHIDAVNAAIAAEVNGKKPRTEAS